MTPIERSAGGGAGASGLVSLFNTTLGADAASIDTGAGGIAGGHGVLMVWILARTADAAAGGLLSVTVNNDGSAIYDTQNVNGSAAAAGAGNTAAQTSWTTSGHGSGGSAGYASVWYLTIPGYDSTTFWKTATMLIGVPDATNTQALAADFVLGYRSSTAISRFKVAGATANLRAGSKLIILGTA